MMNQTVYVSQVALLIQCLPAVAKETCFAIKGGTAINLFIRDLPRLSVDIDLVYLPLMDRNQTVVGIETGLINIKKTLEQQNPGLKIHTQINKATQTAVIVHSI
jgi:hypothetical protein